MREHADISDIQTRKERQFEDAINLLLATAIAIGLAAVMVVWWSS